MIGVRVMVLLDKEGCPAGCKPLCGVVESSLLENERIENHMRCQKMVVERNRKEGVDFVSVA